MKKTWLTRAGVAIADPDAVNELWPLAIGQRKRLFIGGKSGVIGAQPIEMEVEVIQLLSPARCAHFRRISITSPQVRAITHVSTEKE